MGTAFGTAAIFDIIAALVILTLVGTWRRRAAPQPAAVAEAELVEEA
jgi:hypothetical protein